MSNTTKPSSSTASLSSLAKAYRKLRIKLLKDSTDQDLINLITLIGKYSDKDLPHHIAKIVTAFAVAALSEEGVRRLKNRPKFYPTRKIKKPS